MRNKVYVYLYNNLGNVFFSYICGKYYAEKENKEIIFVKHFTALRGNAFADDVIRNTFFKYDSFIDELNDGFDRNIGKLFCDNFGNPTEYFAIPSIEGNVIIEGMRQNPKYFTREFASKELASSKALEDLLKNMYYDVDFNNVVSINIRRVDFLKHEDIFYIPDIEWYNKIIKMYDEKQKFLIISDDLKWCKENFRDERFIFANREITNPNLNKAVADFYLQTYCKDNIIGGGSTFSWWASYINCHKDRKVYYHSPWTKFSKDSDAIPENDNWIGIE